jgi:hypothetical protein
MKLQVYILTFNLRMCDLTGILRLGEIAFITMYTFGRKKFLLPVLPLPVNPGKYR